MTEGWESEGLTGFGWTDWLAAGWGRVWYLAAKGRRGGEGCLCACGRCFDACLRHTVVASWFMVVAPINCSCAALANSIGVRRSQAQQFQQSAGIGSAGWGVMG